MTCDVALLGGAASVDRARPGFSIAEVLFEEMVSQKNFKPRIPSYNTMIQFYTHIVRDRERALHYFGAMLSAGISPTAHTYKLLIDCYGTIEPADVHSMEDVFMNLCSDRRVQVQGLDIGAYTYFCSKPI